MRDWILELRDSDGNDCTVFDILITATSPEQALEKACERAEKDFGGEPDGSFGAYYGCDCTCEECGHAGHERNDCGDDLGTHLLSAELGHVRKVCECTENNYCDGHGGWSINEMDILPYPENPRASYHSPLEWREHPELCHDCSNSAHPQGYCNSPDPSGFLGLCFCKTA